MVGKASGVLAAAYHVVTTPLQVQNSGLQHLVQKKVPPNLNLHSSSCFPIIYHVGPPNCKLVCEPQEYYTYKYHKS